MPQDSGPSSGRFLKLSRPLAVISPDKGEVLDRKAFERLYAELSGAVLGYMTSALRNPSLAEELTQETFLRVYRHRASYQSGTNLTAWVWAIARNALIDHQRKKREVLADDFAADDSGPQIESMAIELNDAEAQLIEHADRAALEGCLNALKAGPREALRLRVFSDLSYEDIAAELEQSVGAIKTWIHRAKKDLLLCVNAKRGQL